MDNIKEKIYQIIKNQFQRDFFYDQGSITTTENINVQIKKFEKENPNASTIFSSNLSNSFPNIKMENFTHFFNHDRCIRFLIQISEEKRFICQLSVFNYFSVYQHSAKLAHSRYEYEVPHYVNINESEICDEIYRCSNVNSIRAIWLSRDILNEVVDEFSILDDDPLFRYEIKISDILFTDHYI